MLWTGYISHHIWHKWHTRFFAAVTWQHRLHSIDIIAALWYLLKWGGGQRGCTKNQDLVAISNEIWQCLFQQKIIITAKHLAGNYECRDRQGIQANQGFQGMETKLLYLQRIDSDKRNTRSESVCLVRVTQINLVHLLENRSFQSGQSCFSNILSSQVNVCFSPFCTHSTGFSESKSGSMSSAHNNPSMDRPLKLSGASENVCKRPNTFTSTQRSA